MSEQSRRAAVEADQLVVGLEKRLKKKFRAVIVVGIPKMPPSALSEGESLYWRVYPGSLELAGGLLVKAVQQIAAKMGKQGDLDALFDGRPPPGKKLERSICYERGLVPGIEGRDEEDLGAQDQGEEDSTVGG